MTKTPIRIILLIGYSFVATVLGRFLYLAYQTRRWDVAAVSAVGVTILVVMAMHDVKSLLGWGDGEK
jgi:hypothetical protein